MKKIFFLSLAIPFIGKAQTRWQNADHLFQPLPASVHVYYTADTLPDGKPNIAYYVTAKLDDPKLAFTAQVGEGKRYTPTQYYDKDEQPLLVMNCTFFEFVHHSNLNVVVKDGQMKAYQVHSLAGKGKDTLTYRHTFGSAIGISKTRKADVAWLYTDSANAFAYASQQVIPFFKDSVAHHKPADMLTHGKFSKWDVETAVGGGPVLIQDGNISIANNEEQKFSGKAINDKHPRTAMGYTKDGLLVLMVVEGRNPGKAEGVTLVQEAQLLKEIGCVEALNLDGGGSSSLLINGKPTIKVSDKEGERPVPAVFVVKNKGK